jgi:hypothetical protein
MNRRTQYQSKKVSERDIRKEVKTFAKLNFESINKNNFL